jgi:hypothetical protein
MLKVSSTEQKQLKDLLVAQLSTTPSELSVKKLTVTRDSGELKVMWILGAHKMTEAIIIVVEVIFKPLQKMLFQGQFHWIYFSEWYGLT